LDRELDLDDDVATDSAGVSNRGQSTDSSEPCQRVPFEAGAPVGIGFTVRNEAPVAVTVVSVEPIGR
jgi:hypothetical protein